MPNAPVILNLGASFKNSKTEMKSNDENFLQQREWEEKNKKLVRELKLLEGRNFLKKTICKKANQQKK